LRADHLKRRRNCRWSSSRRGHRTPPVGAADLKSGALTLTSLVADEMKVRVYGDAAVVTGRNTLKGKYQGMDINGQIRWTDTWVKHGGRWQCAATHGSKVAQK